MNVPRPGTEPLIPGAAADFGACPGPDEDPGAPSRRRHRVRNALVGLLVCVAVLTLILAGGVFYLQHRLLGQVDRVDGVFDDLPNRPEKLTHGPAAAALNILLLGTDRRSAVATTGAAREARPWVPGAQRTDAMMLLHIDGDRRGASVMSFPRDAWVPVPGQGMAKINAAYSFGGPSLAVRTVEDLTGVRIDHLAIVDWEGFRQLTDDLGGVTVTIPETVHDSARNITWTAGVHTLDGQQALDYVGQRYGLPEGDLDRVRRQQNFLRVLMEASLHQRMRKDPRMLFDFLDTVTKNLTVDSEWSGVDMARLALSLRSLRTADVDYFTVPVWGLGYVGDQSVVHLDQTHGARLWEAVREDRVEHWMTRNSWVETGLEVR